MRNWLVLQFLQWARPVWDWNKFRCKVIIAPFCFATLFFDLVQITFLNGTLKNWAVGQTNIFVLPVPQSTSHSSAWCFSNQLKLFKANRWSSNMTQCDWCDIDFWSKFKMLWLLSIEKKAFSLHTSCSSCFCNQKVFFKPQIWPTLTDLICT